MRLVTPFLLDLILSLLLCTNALCQESLHISQFEQERARLLKQLQDTNQEVVQDALSVLEFEIVSVHGSGDDYEEKNTPGIKRSVMERLVQLLESESSDTRKLAMRRLEEIGPQASIALPKLRELLAKSDSYTKLNAAQTLWAISGNAKESAAALVQLIRDDEDAGPSTVWPFELMGSAAFSSFDGIQELADDPRDRVRETVTKILGSFGPTHRHSTEALIQKRLADTSREVRIAASLSLLRIDGALDDAVDTLTEIIVQPIRHPSVAFKESPEEKLAISAMQALDRFEGDAVDAVPALCIQLSAKNFNVRLAGAQALLKIGPGAEEAIPFLSKTMRETETVSVPLVHYVGSVGNDAARALGSIGLAAVPVLIEALDDPESVVRIRAARELGGISDGALQSVGPLTTKLQDASPSVRLESIKSLGNLGKVANAAVPAVTRFLFHSGSQQSLQPDEDPESNETILSSEALKSIRNMDATEAQVVPVLLAGFDRKQDITLPGIAAIKKYANRRREFEKPLRRLLAERNLGAASALATMGAHDSEIQTVLAGNLFQDERMNYVAAMGIVQLVAHGAIINEEIHSQLSEAKKKPYLPLFLRTIFLRLNPDDHETIQSFLNQAREVGSLFRDEIETEEAEAALENLLHHQNLKHALMKDLENPGELARSSFLSARVLIAANQELGPAFACLEKQAELNGEVPAFGSVADFLGQLPPSERSKSVLTKLLERHDGYLVHGDLYGRGGERRCVGDRAALALVQHKEVSTLIDQLEAPDAILRLRIVRALGDCGVKAITPRLLECAKDLDPKVRLELIKTFGKIGLAHPEKRDELWPILEAATKDQRRSISDEASRVIRRWPQLLKQTTM